MLRFQVYLMIPEGQSHLRVTAVHSATKTLVYKKWRTLADGADKTEYCRNAAGGGKGIVSPADGSATFELSKGI